MSELKFRIEKLFERFGYFVCRNSIKTLALMFFLIGLLVSQLPRLTIDTSFEGMLHENDPGRVQYNNFRDDFGQDRILLVTVQTPDIFHEKYLKQLKSLHEDFEDEIPHLDEVKSLINARRTVGDGDTLIVGELLEGWPEKPVDLSAVKKFAMENPVYVNDYISEDGRVAAFVIRPRASVAESDLEDALDGFDEDASGVGDESGGKASARRHYLSKEENRDVIDAVNRIVQPYRAGDFKIAVAGGPVTEAVYDRVTEENMKKFGLIMVFVVLLALFTLFRRISGAIYPLLIVYSSLLSTLGVMAICNVSISVFSVILPSFLTAVGIADSVHILAIFYRRFQNGGEKYDSIAHALGHSGVAIVMTSITTAAGLLSFSMSEISAIAHLGVFAAIGVCLALIYTVVMLPAFLALTPIRRKQGRKKPGKSVVMDAVLISFADFSSSHPGKIIIGSGIIFLIAAASMMRLEFAHTSKKMFPEKMTVRQDMDFIGRHLKGIPSIEIIVDAKKENGLYDPEVLRRIEVLKAELVRMEVGEIYVGKVRTMNDILKEIHQALHQNNPAYYAIPGERALIAQELLLFENSGSEDLERIVDSRFSRTRISIKIPWAEILSTDRFINRVYALFEREFAGLADVSVTGMMTIMGKAVSAAIRSMAKSYVAAFFVISILMILLVGDLKLGLLSMIPNLFPIFLIMGVMGAFGVTIDLNALMIGSIAIGLVVDDTMHFMYNYRRYYDMEKNPRQAVRETLLSTGRALLITSLVLAANFFVLLFGQLIHANKFGLFTGLVILLALLADFILAPALMVQVAGRGEGRGSLIVNR
ncbi:MAG: MMPL family transporter [Desulfobacterales bacterium]|nr:MMPL family transporter [Desulfobacterales bacterium]